MRLTNIYFNHYNSLDDLNLSILEIKDIPVANEIIEKIDKYIIRTGEYEDIEITIKFRYRRKEKNIFDIQESIIDWISNIEDNNLIFSFNPDKCYKVKYVKFGDIARLHNTFNSFELTFICEPFKYLPNEYHINLSNNSTLYYQGNVSGEPNIKIYGNGNIQLTINNETVQINNVNEYVELDSKLLLCLDKDKRSKTRDMIGHFLLLNRGPNEISWTGSVTKVKILPRTAYK